MDWLLLAVLGIIWAAFLVPRRGASAESSVHEFEGDMQRIAHVQHRPGRWLLVPRKGERFVGPQARARFRARERRRRVFTVLLEAAAISFLIGVVPPLRAMWVVTVVVCGLLVAYTWALLRMAGRGAYRPRHTRPSKVLPGPEPDAPVARARVAGRRPAAEPALAPVALFDGAAAYGGNDVEIVVSIPEADQGEDLRVIPARAGSR